MYTDASFYRRKRNGGGGIVWTDVNHKIINQLNFHIPITESSTHAELLTMLVALENTPEKAKITAFCDNKHVVRFENNKRWKKNKDISYTMKEIIRKKNLSIKFKWKKSHKGFELNELADSLAEEGSKSGNRADMYEKIQSGTLNYYWTDGISTDPNIKQKIIENRTKDPESSDFHLPDMTDVHPCTWNHWKGKAFNSLESSILLKLKIDAFYNKNYKKEIKPCIECNLPATLEHCISLCPKHNISREETVKSCQNLITEATRDGKFTMVWNTERTSPSKTEIFIGWRGTISESSYRNLRQMIKSKRNRLGTMSKTLIEEVKEVVDKIMKMIADFSYKTMGEVTRPNN